MIDKLTTENLLIVAERPAELDGSCRTLIARLSGMGRQPFVVVLTEGHAANLALDYGRQLAFGVPEEMLLISPAREAAVKALCFISWRYDCNLLGRAGQSQAADKIARLAAEEAGIGFIVVSK